MKLVGKSQLAKIAKVSPAAITKAVKSGRLVVVKNNKIDQDAPATIEFISAALQRQRQGYQEPPESRAAGAGRKPKPYDPSDPSKDSLEKKKLAADIQGRELRNAQLEGRLVARELMIRGVWNPLETFLVRILSDGAKTMAATVHPLVKAGGSREEIEVAIRNELSSFIVPLKESIQKALKLEEDV